jgi:hypothetical protein
MDAPKEGLIYGTRETSISRIEGSSLIQSIYRTTQIGT